MEWINGREVVDFEKGKTIPVSNSSIKDVHGEKVLVEVRGGDAGDIIFQKLVPEFGEIVTLQVSWQDLAIVLKKFYYVSERG